MSVSALLRQIEEAGATVTADGGHLRVRYDGELPAQLLEAVRAAKRELLAALTSDTPAYCYDCRPSHPGIKACNGRGFLVGAVIIDTPAHWKRATHCPVCCPGIATTRGGPRKDAEGYSLGEDGERLP